MKLIKSLTILLALFLVMGTAVNAQSEVVEGLRQPAQLTIQHETSDSNVYLSWWNPGDPTWLFYGNGYIYGTVTFNTGHYEIATKYEKEDFAAYHGMSLKKFAFVADVAGHPYTLSVWTGENGDVLEYSQEIDTVETQAWTYVDFTAPLVIDTSKTYYIGLAFDVATEGAAAGIAYGPAIEKGSLIRNSEGDFISILEYNLDYNWGMAIYIELDVIAKGQVDKPVQQSNLICSTDISDATKVDNEIKLNTEMKSSKAVSYFNIYRNSEVVATSDTVGYHDQLLDGGNFIYEVSAVYAEGESYPSNAVEIFYDNNRIPKNIMVLESFINIGQIEGGGLQSPGSPGAVKGVHEMNYQYDVAPIAYHSAVQILGPDPFSFPEGENRWWYYMVKTFAFPATHFNGSVYLGGGQDDTMFEVYDDIYQSIKNVKTAIYQESYLEGVTASTFKLHSNFEVVGIYNTEHLVVHTVITESNIPYSWHSGEFDDVNFVAREMVPDANGTFVTFEEGKASLTQDIEIDPFVAKENFNVITFIQDTLTLEIVNAEKLNIPTKKVITFEAKHKEEFVENVSIAIGEEIIYTDKDGIAKISIFSNGGSVNYTVSHDDYIASTDSFFVDTTDFVAINLTAVGVEQEREAIFNVYPNPATDIVNVQSTSNFECFISDISGKIVKSNKTISNQHSIDISDFESGIYFIQTKTKNKTSIFKILKQ